MFHFWLFITWTLGLSGLFLPSLANKQPPNFVFVLTDDQDVMLDGLIPMKHTAELLASQGITFTNAFVNSPICCPSRSTILTGKYAHNLNVWNNSLSGNCSSRQWQENFEPFSVAALLKQTKNYTTFYAGKYLNQYGARDAGGTQHVPAGYDWWLGLKGNSKYYNFTLSINGTAEFFSEHYLTDTLSKFALEFLNSKSEGPFFMMVTPPAPHAPFIPAPRHRARFPYAKVVRNPSFNYTAENKHWLVAMPPDHLPDEISVLHQIQRKRLQSLLAVDEMVKKIVFKLKEMGVFENTYFIFSSDNGFHIGQFTQPWDKRQPYETDIRVPFIISGPGIPKNITSDYPISAVDITPTILDLAGISYNAAIFDGNSFADQILNSYNIMEDYNRFVLIEYWGEGNSNSIDPDCPWGPDDDLAECSRDSWCKCQDSRNNTYTCFMHLTPTLKMKFCNFASGFFEVYDLMLDPFELNNIHEFLGQQQQFYYEAILDSMRSS